MQISSAVSSNHLFHTDQYLRQSNTTYSSSKGKWVIMDVSAPHCQGQHRFHAPKGWTVLLARETSMLKNDNWTMLDALSLDSAGSKSGADDGECTMSKNEAYLRAIRSGASDLLDIDCSMSADHVLSLLHVSSVGRYGLVYTDTRLFNPYGHFGAWAGIPRAIGDGNYVNNSRTYYIRDVYHTPVKHALNDKSRDMLTVQDRVQGSTDSVGVTFDPTTPPVFLGRRSFAPAMPASSLYQQQALWGVLLPCVTPTPACHVLRQLVLQRLLWELDAFPAYYQMLASVDSSSLSADNPGSQSLPKSPSVPTSLSVPQSVSVSQSVSSPQSVSQPVPVSQSLPALDVGKLTSLLDAWTCAANLTFYGCFLSLFDLLYTEGFMQQQDQQLVRSWIKALNSSGLVEPSRVTRPFRGRRKTGEVKMILGSLRHRVESSGKDSLQNLWQQSVQPVVKWCNSSDDGWLPSPAHWTSPVIDDIVLIVVFNWREHIWPNAAFIETVHRPFFQHIVYCVSDVDQLSRAPEYEAWRHVTVVEGLSDSWLMMYGCVTSVMQMKLAGVRGYLMIGDDTLLNTWKFFNLSRDVILQHPGRNVRDATKNKVRIEKKNLHTHFGPLIQLFQFYLIVLCLYKRSNSDGLFYSILF